MENKLTVTENNFNTPGNFDHAQRVAKAFASSNLIPKDYQGNVQNTLIAMEMAKRIGASPLMVMQNLNIIQGKPSWSSTFVIGAINACKKFSPLRYEMSGEGEDYGCTAWAYDAETKEKLEGPKVTLKMATAEGWTSKSGSKWKNMPELMFRYRAATFFGRLYAPEILMGMLTADEVIDIQPMAKEEIQVNKEEERTTLLIQDATTVEDLIKVKEYVTDVNMDLYGNKFSELTENEL